MTPDRIEEIYNVCLETSLELEADPTILGPRYINNVISTCRNYLNKVVMILLEIQKEKRVIARLHAGAKTAFKVEADNLLASDDRVRGLPNIKDREAFINYLLADRQSAISDFELQLLDLDTVEKTVRLRHQELVRTSDNIKTQRSLLLADRSSGAGYGDETDRRDAKGRLLPPDEEGVNEGEIDRLLAAQFPAVMDAPSETAVTAVPETIVEAPEEVQASEEASEPSSDPVVAVVASEADEVVPEEVQTPPIETKVEESFTPAALPEDDLDALLAMIPDSPPPTEATSSVTADPVPETSVDQGELAPATEEEVAQFLDAPGPEIEASPVTTVKTKASSKSAHKPTKKAEPAGEEFDFSDILTSM